MPLFIRLLGVPNKICRVVRRVFAPTETTEKTEKTEQTEKTAHQRTKSQAETSEIFRLECRSDD